MSIEITEVPTPMSTSYTMFADMDKDILREKKTIRVCPMFKTKTRLFQSFQIGEWNNGVNWVVDGFKMHETSTISFGDFERINVGYFKLMKSQGKAEYFEYLKELAKKFLAQYGFSDIDTITLEVETDRVFK